MLDTFDELENYPNAYHRNLVEIVVRKDDVENFSRCRSIYEQAMDAEGKNKMRNVYPERFQDGYVRGGTPGKVYQQPGEELLFS